MGLDVTLRKCPNWEASLAKQDAYEEKSEAIWDGICKGRKYEELSQDEKDIARTKTSQLKTELGLDEYGGCEDIETIENDHPDYPKHMFKIGYLRSSYNDGGINSVLRRMGVPDLYEIFGVGDDHPYHLVPDWSASLNRCNEAIQKYKVAKASPIGAYDCFDEAHNPFMSMDGLPESDEEALKVFDEELKRRSETKRSNQMDWYSNGKGQFRFPSIAVSALIPGKKYGRPTIYVIYKPKKEKGGVDWYLQALEITRDMIHFVLDQPDIDTYRLAWSS